MATLPASWGSSVVGVGYQLNYVGWAPLKLLQGGSSLSSAEVFLSMCDVLVNSSLLVVGETSPVLVEVSVIVTSDSSRVAAKNSVVPL